MSCCEKYEPGCAEIDRYILTAFARNGDSYKNPPFRYCPWCGKEPEKPVGVVLDMEKLKADIAKED